MFNETNRVGIPGIPIYTSDGHPSSDNSLRVPKGGVCKNTVTGRVFMNTGTARRPRWTKLPKSEVKIIERKPDIFWEPTPIGVVRELLIMANVGSDDIVYDIGCGDGRFPIIAASEFGCKKAVGVDLSPSRIQMAIAAADSYGVSDRVTFLMKDFFDVDISEATVMCLYLTESLVARLLPKLAVLAPGSRIVSHEFSFGELECTRKIEHIDGDDHILSMLTIPEGGLKLPAEYQ